jgi:hypothetical protein
MFLQKMVNQNIVNGSSLIESHPKDYRISMIVGSAALPMTIEEAKAQFKWIKQLIVHKKISQATGVIVPFCMNAVRLNNAALLKEFEGFILPLLADFPTLTKTKRGPLNKASSDQIYLITHTLLGATLYGLWTVKLVTTTFMLTLLEKLFVPWKHLIEFNINADVVLEIFWVSLIARRYCGGLNRTLQIEFSTLKTKTLPCLLPPEEPELSTKFHQFHSDAHKSMLIFGILKESQVNFLFSCNGCVLFRTEAIQFMIVSFSLAGVNRASCDGFFDGRPQ